VLAAAVSKPAETGLSDRASKPAENRVECLGLQRSSSVLNRLFKTALWLERLSLYHCERLPGGTLHQRLQAVFF
jgi:hypothetical protein